MALFMEVSFRKESDLASKVKRINVHQEESRPVPCPENNAKHLITQGVQETSNNEQVEQFSSGNQIFNREVVID